MKKGKRLALLLVALLTLSLAGTVTSFAEPAPTTTSNQAPITDVPYFNQGLVVQDWTYGDSADKAYDVYTNYDAYLRYPNNDEGSYGGEDNHNCPVKSRTGTDPDYSYTYWKFKYYKYNFQYRVDSGIQYLEVSDTFDPTKADFAELDKSDKWKDGLPTDAGKYIARMYFHTAGDTPTSNSYDYGDADYHVPSYNNMYGDTSGTSYGNVIYSNHYEHGMFSIAPKEITSVVWPEENKDKKISFEYDGKAHTPIARGAEVVGDDVCELVVATTPESAINVQDDDYSATVTGIKDPSTSNYVLHTDDQGAIDVANGTHAFSITPKEISLTWPDNNEFTYDGQDHTPNAEVGGVAQGDTLNLDYKLDGEKTKAIDAGNYTVTASLPLNCKNYALPSTGTSFAFKINQLEAILDWSKGDTFIYDGERQTPSATVSNVKTREDASNPDTVNVTVAARPGQTPIDAGVYSVRATGLDNDNYKLPEAATHNITILAKPLALGWADTNSFVYNGTAQARKNNLQKQSDSDWDGKLVSDQTVVVGFEVSTNNDALRLVKSTGGIDVGNYDIAAVSLSDSNGNPASNYVLINRNNINEYVSAGGVYSDLKSMSDTKYSQFEITPLMVTLAWTNTELTYNGKLQAPTATITNLVTVAGYDKDDCTVNVIGYQKDAGDYADKDAADAFNLEGAQAANYTLDGAENRTKDFSIAKAALTVTANPKSITYGQAPSNEGVTYKTLLGEDKASDIEKELGLTYAYNYVLNGKPGSYAITPSGAAETTNYKVKYGTGELSVSDNKTVLAAKAVSKGKKSLKFSWSEVSGTAKYEVYIAKCGKKKVKKIATVSGSPFKFTKKGLKAKTAYHFYVVAKDNKGNVIAKSRVGHVVTSKYKGKYTNAKKITVNASSINLKKDGTFKLSAKYKKAKKGKKLLSKGHAKLTRFVSDNPAVATVDANGVVKGVSTGWCRVYVQGVDGIWKAVQVNVQ